MSIVGGVVLFFFACVLCPLFVQAAPHKQKVTIVYSGQTHAALYPCHCPVESDGGLSRRATMLKEMRKKDPYLIVLDAGNAFAGGVFDEYARSLELDMIRTATTLKAMDAMSYNALAIGADEFNFGYSFLCKGIEQSRLDFLSSNIKVEKAKPYIILEVEGLRIGVIGVTDPVVAAKLPGRVEMLDPAVGVYEAQAAIRKLGGQVVVVLSSLDKDGIKALLNTVSGIDIFINANSKNKDMPESGVFGNTVILNSSWQGRALGVLELDMEDGKIKSWNARSVRLSGAFEDDKDITAIVPACFSDGDCMRKGLVGTCQNPGLAQAQCRFSAAHPVGLTIITVKDPLVPENKKIIAYLSSLFPGLKATYLYYPQAKAAKLVKDLSIKALPAYLFDSRIKQESGFSALGSNFEQKGRYYLLSTHLTGILYYLDRQKINGKIDLFMSLYYPHAAPLIQTIKEFDPAVHFLSLSEATSFDASRGDPEREESLRSVCVQKYYPQKFWDYIECRSRHINSTWWKECLEGAPPALVESCARSAEGEELLKNNTALARELKITTGPAYVINNQEIYGSNSKEVPRKEEFKKLFKK